MLRGGAIAPIATPKLHARFQDFTTFSNPNKQWQNIVKFRFIKVFDAAMLNQKDLFYLVKTTLLFSGTFFIIKNCIQSIKLYKKKDPAI